MLISVGICLYICGSTVSGKRLRRQKMVKVNLTDGEYAIFRAMMDEPAMRVQEDSLPCEGLRYGLIRFEPGKPALACLIDNEVVFGLMALGLIEIDGPADPKAIWQSSIYKLSELAKTLVEI